MDLYLFCVSFGVQLFSSLCRLLRHIFVAAVLVAGIFIVFGLI
jgi:hypothetical protein